MRASAASAAAGATGRPSSSALSRMEVTGVFISWARSPMNACCRSARSRSAATFVSIASAMALKSAASPGQLVPAAAARCAARTPPRQGGRARAQLLHGSERARDDPPQQQPGDEEHGRAGRGAPDRQRGDARGQAGNVPHEAEAVFLRAELERAAQQQIARAADAHGPVPLRPVRREGMAALEQRLRRKAGVVGEIFRPQQQRIFLRAGRGAERVQDAAAPHERALPRLLAARGAHGRAESLHVRARLLQRGIGRIRPRKAQHQRAAGGHRRHDQQHRAEGQPRPELHHQSSRR